MVHFFTIEVYIFEIYFKFCVFWYPWSPYCEKQNFDPYIVNDPKSCYQLLSVNWLKNFFFCYFRYFWSVCNKSQGYFCWNCKKVKNQPTLMYISDIFWPRSRSVWENTVLHWQLADGGWLWTKRRKNSCVPF
jgi:hypothetical protein